MHCLFSTETQFLPDLWPHKSCTTFPYLKLGRTQQPHMTCSIQRAGVLQLWFCHTACLLTLVVC
uniref:Cysteine-rich repeat secretory protein 3-like isoform X2 n=1 Tax=Rhizophora mucronata TaxID=61149 RepID=A0A2P2Q3V6_RHIMU